MSAIVEITLPKRASRRHSISGAEALLGRSPGCDLCLPEAQDLPLEHLRLRQNQDGLLISLVTPGAPPLTFRGQTLTSCQVPWDEEVYTAGIRIKPEQVSHDRWRMVRVPAALSIAVLLVLFAVFASRRQADGGSGESQGERKLAPPELVAGSVPCSQPSVSDVRASEAEGAALAKLQRYPFAAGDGVQALRLLTEAVGCYQQAGLAEDAARVRRQLDAAERRLNRDYSRYRLRLRLALKNADAVEALREIGALRSLLEPGEGVYVEWLKKLERAIGDNRGVKWREKRDDEDI